MKQAFYSVEELARILRISISTLRRRLKAGLITFIKVERRILIRREAVEAYIARYQHVAAV